MAGATIADAAAGGMHAALAIMAALIDRGPDGSGTHLDVAVADGVLWLMSLAVDEHLATGAPVGHGHDIISGRYACYDSYAAADGRWLAVGAIEHRFFANLCRLLGCEQWVDHQLDDEAQDKMRADFRAAFAQKDRDTWVELLSGVDTCVAPVLAVGEVVDDQQFTEPRRLRRGAAVRHRRGHTTAVPPGRTGAGRDAGPGGAGRASRPGRDADRGAPVGRRAAGRADRRSVRRRSGGVTAIGEADIERTGRRTSVRRRRRVPRRAGLHLDVVRVRRERQPVVLGARGGRAGDRRPHRPAHHGVGVVPAPPLGAQPDDLGVAPPGALRPEGGARPARGGDDRQHDRLLRAGPSRRPAAYPADPALGERGEDHPAGHRPLLGDRRRVPQPTGRAGGDRELHGLRLPPAGRRGGDTQ